LPKSKKEKAADIEKQTRRFYLDMLIMLAAPVAMAWYYYGMRAPVLLVVCVAASAFCDAVGGFIVKRKRMSPYDFNAIFTGAVIALMLPATFPFAFAVAGSAFAVIVAKIPFGGTRGALFVPAAAGFAFLCICWPSDVFSYPVISAQTGTALASGAEFATGTSLASMLHSGNSLMPNIINYFDMLSGNMPGPMGTGSVMVLAATSVYLLIRKPVALLNTLGFLLSCGVMALLNQRVGTGPLSSLLSELCSGALVFAALFLVTDPSTSPVKPLHRLFCGIITGILCMVMRYFGAFEEGVCFAVLLSNAAWPFAENLLNKLGGFPPQKKKRERSASVSAVKGGGADA
jgi:Na+-translocating ferredoxin:NAD+ oxidoreductase subunit D